MALRKKYIKKNMMGFLQCYGQCEVFVRVEQGVTKRCRLSSLTNSALVYESQTPNAVRWVGLRGVSQ
jgi:hypothetical protein